MAGIRGNCYTDEQVIAVQKEAAAPGAVVLDVLRRHSVTANVYYKLKAKYAGMEVSDAKKLRRLEEGNRRLKNLVARQALEN